MPGLDGTGPEGMGPMTGGGFGRCGNNNAQAGTGRGLARGRGRGFRRYTNRNVVDPVVAADAEQSQSAAYENEILRQQNLDLEAKIEALNSKIDALTSTKNAKKKKS